MMDLHQESRAFLALFHRDIKLFTTYRVSVIMTILWPLPILALNLYNYEALSSPTQIRVVLGSYGLSDYKAMVIIGTLVYLFYNRLLWGTGRAIQRERRTGTLELLFLTPVNRVTLLIASGLASVIEASWWIGTIFGVSLLFFGFTLTLENLSVFTLVLALTILVIMTMGMFFAGLFVLSRSTDVLTIGLQAPFRFFSGVAFPVQSLPFLLQYVSYALPLTYAIDALRRTIATPTPSPISYDILVLCVFALTFAVLARVLISRVERQAKLKGDLYMY